MTRHAELANKYIKKEEPEVPLTIEKAEELAKRIAGFTTDLIKGLAQKDAAGRTVINPQESGFEVMLSMEKDKFKKETGYSTEYVSKMVRAHREQKQKEELEAKLKQRAEESKAKLEGNASEEKKA